MPFLPARRYAPLRRILLADLPAIPSRGRPQPTELSSPGSWPLERGALAATLLPGAVLSACLVEWSGSLPLGGALALLLIARTWRRAAVRYGHEVLRRLTHHLRGLSLRSAEFEGDALAAAADRLLVAVIGLFPLSFLLQSITFGLQAVGSAGTMLLAFVSIPVWMVVYLIAIRDALSGYRTVNHLTDGLLDRI
ncbi:MAG: hypothetical protein Q4F49_02390 [Pseudoxanthomonas suwonensis]|nr:hypothetical protein [Pseudoxanthomonas suwonensis]